MADEMDLRDSDWLADLTAGNLVGQELRAVLAARLGGEDVEKAVVEVEVARRVRALMLNLRQAEMEVPADFEAHLLERVRGDQTLLDLLELHLTGFGGVLVELINAFFSFLPAATQAHTKPV